MCSVHWHGVGALYHKSYGTLRTIAALIRDVLQVMLYIASYTGCPNTVHRAAVSNVLVEWAEPTITSQVARALSSSHLPPS